MLVCLCSSCDLSQGVWRELEAQVPPSREAYEAMIDACLSTPEGLDTAVGILDDMWKRGFDLQRLYFETMQGVSVMAVYVFQIGKGGTGS